MKRKPRIYIAGPYTAPDVAVNVRTAIETADFLMNAGCLPYTPHLTHFQHLIRPRPYEDWMELDLAWLECCDCVFRLDGESPGADRETARAKELGLLVFESSWEFSLWLREWKETP